MGYDNLSQKFCRGAFRNVKEFDGLPICIQLIPFRNIAWDRNGGSTDLVSQTPVFCKGSFPRELIKKYSEFFSPLPNIEFLKISHFSPSPFAIGLAPYL